MDVASDENTPGRDNEYSCHSCALDYCSQHSFCRTRQIFKPDSRLFFGGDSDTDELIGRLARFPVLVIIGNSGSGKSSLMRAGADSRTAPGPFSVGGATDLLMESCAFSSCQFSFRLSRRNTAWCFGTGIGS
jgi:hypothetical protein